MNTQADETNMQQYTAPTAPTLTLAFGSQYDLVQCYETIFRTVPLYDLNGCTFFHRPPEVAGVGFQVYIASADEASLIYAQNQLTNSPAFMQTQSRQVLARDVLPQCGMLAGRVVNNQLEPAFAEGGSPLASGWQNAMGPMIVENGRGNSYGNCPQCGAFLGEQIFCGQCGAKVGRLSGLSKGFLIVYSLLYGGQFLFAFFGMLALLGYPGMFGLFAVTTLEGALCIGGAILLFRSRKVGFYMIVAERVLNLFVLATMANDGVAVLGTVSSGAVLGFASILGMGAFVGIAYGCLHKDLRRMK